MESEYLQRLNIQTLIDDLAVNGVGLPENGIPAIEAPSMTIGYRNISQLNFADELIYNGASNNIIPPTVSYLNKETLYISKLAENLELGEKFLALIYSYRASAVAIPQTGSSIADQTARSEFYSQVLKVLRPEINKIKDLQRYCEESTNLFGTTVRNMISEYREGFASSQFLLTLARTLDMFFVIDTMKNYKNSLNNDLSMYKRYLANIKNLAAFGIEDETSDHQALYSFLGTRNVFAMKLKEKLAQIQQHDELLIDLINYCCQMLDNRSFLIPNVKYMLLKAMTFALYLLDSEADDITKKKRLRIDRVTKLLKSHPVIPFFGDISMTLATVFSRNSKIHSLRLEHDPKDETLIKSYLIVNRVEQQRQTFIDYTIRLQQVLNTYKRTASREVSSLSPTSISPTPSSPNSQPVLMSFDEQIYNLLLEGITLLGDWTSRVLDQSAWKFAHPADQYTNPDCPATASQYEQAVRYNYSTKERLALVTSISLIKSLEKQLLSISNDVLQALYRYVYSSTQRFVKGTVREMMVYAEKKKKPAVMAIVQHVYAILSDAVDSDDQSPRSPSATVSTGRAISVAITQLHYTKVLLEAATSDKAKGMSGGFLKEKDFKDSHVTEVNDYLARALHYPTMLDFMTTVAECADLSELWYKEYYLELTKQIQFPIEMSLPWILAETVIDSEEPELVESLLYPFSLYNDAAQRALYKLRTQFLYDEIEAEVNLCFDQFIWKLSQKIFSYFKTCAASHRLDKTYKKELESRLNVNDDRYDIQNFRWASILKQKQFQLLGRFINIGKLVSQFCNQHFRTSLDISISRYEATDITYIVELENLINVNRWAHIMLSEYIQVDPFDDMLSEIDEEASLVAFNGRIVAHTVQELVTDLIPNFCFNSYTERFVRNPVSVAIKEASPPQFAKVLPMHLYGTKHMFLAHNAVHHLFKSFFGQPHLAAIVNLLGPEHMGVILGELIKSTDVMLTNSFNPYIKALVKGMPHSTKLPPFEYGVKGCFDYFNVLLSPIINYPDLKSGVFQLFQELGNTIIIVRLIENALDVDSVWSSVHLAAMDIPQQTVTDAVARLSEGLEMMVASGEQIDLPGTAVPLQSQLRLLGELYGSKRPPQRLLGKFFTSLRKMIATAQEEWGTSKAKRNELEIDHCTEFYRLWSCLIFAFSLPSADNDGLSNRIRFGDALLWAGCTIVKILGEDRRFKAFDFIRFLTYVISLDTRGIVANDATLNAFHNNAVFVEDYCLHIFDVLEFNLPPATPS